ncbi:response regulator transcription factor [Sphingomonas sp.]|uniref:response regulator transcription factor n=1 Tax=Sphingomonas sp. TaxID=28214 RepID=UPI003CC53797
MAHPVSTEVYVALEALIFLALGLWAGWRLQRPVRATDGTEAAVAEALGITPREREVLDALARGLSTKAIARALGCSPNTVKTHTARLFAKLPAANRTEAAAKARALGLVP